MRYCFYLLLFMLAQLLMTACDNSQTVAESESDTKTNANSSNDHSWKAQTDALKQAQQLRDKLEQQARQKEKNLQNAQ